MHKAVVACGLGLALACSTPSSVAPLSVPLQYKTMASPAEFPTLPACATLSGVTVRDGREEQTLGRRFVEGKSAPAAPVTAANDVAGWVRAGLEAALTRSGVSFAKANQPALRLTIEQISTSENVLHRSGYEGRISVSAELLPPRGGPSCWSGRSEGFAENYGYAGSVENYQETLNHALDRAVIRLVSTPEFKKAVCACGG